MENKNNEEEFFDKREMRSAGRHAEDMDTSFVEPKKHHYFAVFLVFVLLLAVGGACAYYFVLNTPKKFYTTIVDKFLNENDNIINKNTNNDLNYNYSMTMKASVNDAETQKVIDVINNIKITGNAKYDKDNKLLIENSTLDYKNNKLLDMNYMLELDKKTIYLKLNNVLDKVIKFDFAEYEAELSDSQIDTNTEDYIEIYNSIIKAIKLTLENADYERKITKLNNNFVFEEKLLIDKDFKTQLLTKLLQDNTFLETLAKIGNTTVTDISDGINETLSELDDKVSTISVYKTILKDEIIKIELKDEEDSITITKDNNKYNFELIESYKLSYKGYVKLNNDNKEKELTVNFESIEDKVSIDFHFTYSNNSNELSPFDTKNAINYEELTEDDLSKVMENIKDNKALKSLLEDLGLSEEFNQYTDM